MRKVFNLNTELAELRGMEIVKLEYGSVNDRERAEKEGKRFIPLPGKISKAWLGNYCGDAVVFFELENQDEYEQKEFYFYDSENVYLEDHES